MEIKEVYSQWGPLKHLVWMVYMLYSIKVNRRWLQTQFVWTLVSFFENSSQIRQFNDTSIVLIPKVESLDSLIQFQPISHCNVMYKILIKIIANRLRDSMEKLVALNQSDFIPGRYDFDNVIIV